MYMEYMYMYMEIQKRGFSLKFQMPELDDCGGGQNSEK